MNHQDKRDALFAYLDELQEQYQVVGHSMTDAPLLVRDFKVAMALLLDVMGVEPPQERADHG